MAIGEVKYSAHSVLNGIAPGQAAYARGGKLSEGSICEMIQKAQQLIKEGYTSVNIMFGESGDVEGSKSNTIWEGEIEQIAARPDFPERSRR
ncbi:MAG: hypothetical protein MnENMB40S_28920 [Rhizobiaceae bacterium MnEN-MB40S]|nr:MAG: hypothetical protein MnENMB40S_28920 [Rhizobiaceae bacterium MnEN-MB40S]